MAQPQYAIEYLGAVNIKAGEAVTTADVLTTYPSATAMKMKTEDVKVSVDGSAMFPVKYDDESYIITGKTFIFNKDCIVVIGIYKAVT